MTDNTNYPRTVESAVRLMQDLMPKATQAQIASLAEDDLMTDFGLGMWVSSHLGPWKDNAALLQSAGVWHPDDASAIIIRAFWLRLRDDLRKVH